MIGGDTYPYYEHALDVLKAATLMSERGETVALAILTATEGGAVRSLGAMMAISSAGESVGYLSGGCIDADVKLHALNSIDTGQVQSLRYGSGSQFTDIQLPCGGAIEVLICPNTAPATLRMAVQTLAKRKPVTLSIAADGQFSLSCNAHMKTAWQGETFFSHYEPKLQIRIAGRGADCLALARIGQASGLPITLQMAAENDPAAHKSAQSINVETLTTPGALTDQRDDKWTAFVLMFHDPHWEAPLLKQALAGDAFYIGAVGSRKTHARRVDALLDLGCSETEITRIHAPIGLVRAMRDASMLAISALAEVVAAFHARTTT